MPFTTLHRAAALLFMLCAQAAMGQPAAMFPRAIAAYPDLTFSPSFKEMGFFTQVSNSMFKPAGAGPFPAVVLVHTCGGLQPHITDRAKELLAGGYAVLVLDAYGPRNHTAFCQPRGVLPPRVYKDAFDAMQHLSGVKEIDASRIYLVGLSLGSFAAAAAGSPEIAQLVGSAQRFRASVGWYGSCAFNVGPYPKWELIRPDTDRPVLLLLADKDDETPINECFPMLENMKAQGKPVSWHVFADTTHGWDKSFPSRGYVLNIDTTRDAMKKTLDFLKAN